MTQVPLNKDVPEGHVMQSFDDGPLQVRHDVEQREHCWPVLNDEGGHVEFGVTDGSGSHFVLSVRSRLNPFWQEMQSPVLFAHFEHPS